MKMTKLALVFLGSIAIASCGGGDEPSTTDYLDTTFGAGGIVRTDIRIGSGSTDSANSIAIQDNGSIIAAGISDNGSDNDFALTRYTADGGLDDTFGGDGVVTTDIRRDVLINFGGDEDIAKSVAIQGDGKIVVAGYSFNGGNNDFVLVRYNTDGGLDTTFNTNGIVITDIGTGSDDYAHSVALQQTDGKIVVAGYSYNGLDNDFVLVRYNTDGSLDTSFDTDGKVITDIGTGSDDYAHSVALQQTDVKIVVAGYSSSGSDNDFVLVRYNTNGSPDASFDTDGKVITDIGAASDDTAESVAIQTDDMVVVAGYSSSGSDNDFVLVRYNTNGSLDTSFGTDGIVITDIGTGSDDKAYSVTILNGKIVAAGNTFKANTFDFALTRYNTDGSLDTSFGAGGKLTTAIGTGNDEAKAVAIQADGKIVAAGYSLNNSDDDFALVRYVP